MISYEVAKRLAIDFVGNNVITEAYESEDAYKFTNPEAEYSIGGFLPVFVMKNDGRMVSAFEYNEVVEGRGEFKKIAL